MEINKTFKKISFKEFWFNFLILMIMVWGPAYFVYSFWGKEETQILVTHLLNSILIFMYLNFWFFEKYKLDWKAFGFNSLKYPNWVNILIGIFSAVSLLGAINLLYPIIYFHDFGAYLHNFQKMTFDFNKLIVMKIIIIPRLILAPLFEETIFRGFLYQFFRAKFGNIFIALFLQAVFFVLLHFSLYPLTISVFVVFFLKGLVLGLVFNFTQSLISSVACHSMFNILASIM